MADPYIGPQTGILSNIPNFENKEVLREYEYAQTVFRILELRNEPVKGDFDLDHLKKIHGHVFQDVYNWAGEVRTVSLAKGGNLFALPQHIEAEANRLSNLLAKENHLKELDKPEFIERLAHHHGEFNALHPFREGNGRTMQVFVTDLSQKAGYELSFEHIDRKQWNIASRHSYNGDLEPMKSILETAVILI
jgi:cell filamentation protein